MWFDFIPIAMAILIPLGGIAGVIIRYFWKKEKCFITMKNKIEELSNRDKGVLTEHDEYDSRLKDLENDAIEIKIYLRQILTELGISYK